MEKQKAIITGGSRGIGLAIIKKLLEDNYEVWYLSRTEVEENLGPFIHHIKTDVSDKENLVESLNTAVKEAKVVDLLVNNAGITRDGLLMRMSDENWDDVITVNLTSAFITCRALSRTLLKQKHGAIVNISSVVGVSGNAGQANYSASKAGLIGLTKSLAKEFASRGIRVNAVAPGFIETSMTEKLSDAQKEAIVAQIPLKKLGSAEMVADTVRFLASSASQYITGQVICVDGGMVI
ncbi:MAG: 3-oxoacyl-[acyl-carrier-protein] reductase [Spirochaetaceae bacterium]|nr:3-oxoacyl-[acyl-carrier-protein] reductase [Spirochaetaceae bacterium]